MHTVSLTVGAMVLHPLGLSKVLHLQRGGIDLQTPAGVQFVPYASLEVRGFTDDSVQAEHTAISPWWFALSNDTRRQALDRLAIVQEILTGYRYGWPSEDNPGEPFHPFGPGFNASLRQRAIAMERRLAGTQDSSNGGSSPAVGFSTIKRWITLYEQAGLRALVDGRSARDRKDFSDLDSRFRQIVEDVISPFDGTASAVNVAELQRRVWLGMKEGGLSRDIVPERMSAEYVSWRYSVCGSRPRAHRSAKVRKRSAHQPSPIVHPSHVSMDTTRADNLVHDELRQTSYSVEITVIISVATRVVLALRVTPRSVNSIEAGLCLYDAMRPFSLKVEGTNVDDWRWAGVPRSLESPLFPPRREVTHESTTLQGLHHIPGIRPSSFRTDHGAAFMAGHFMGLLRDFGISLWPSRVGASTDNAHIERFWETIQRALQQIPGYKGRNTSQRGRRIVVADQPLMTAHELETYLRRFVALDYHRAPHDGLKIGGLESQRITPLEYFDFAMEACGDITVPQHPDLIYEFLPIRWLTIGHAGTEYKGLSYDSDALDAYRHVRRGTFRADDTAAPFMYDPRDCTRLWFRDPESGRVTEIPSRHQHLLTMPLTQRIRDKAVDAIAARGGNSRLRRQTSTQQIIDELGSLYQAPPAKEWNATMTAERLRFETAQRDHAEAAEAWKRVSKATRRTSTPTMAAKSTDSWIDDAWPDLEGK
ncbi:conserved protein of unknown function [Micropruina glycogenica]|uniref:Integrase catalytic domain-containing protein n=2 Tax=Micropruina glycogenica TaxID=75385 RepID=A0A2N9JK21_9ACTN|nr:conserved protein of unknown function [Micropruina glycogenica]